jgi:hypothetical protein
VINALSLPELADSHVGPGGPPRELFHGPGTNDARSIYTPAIDHILGLLRRAKSMQVSTGVSETA